MCAVHPVYCVQKIYFEISEHAICHYIDIAIRTDRDCEKRMSSIHTRRVRSFTEEPPVSRLAPGGRGSYKQ